MSNPNDTQTIDADALRARLAEMAQRARDEMAPAGLRERIAAALRARHGDGVNIETTRRRFGAPVWGVGVDVGDTVRHLVAGESATEAEALAALAYACGLNPDGTDPRAEVAQLRALLEVAQTSLAAATSGRRVTVVDEIERLQRERDAAECERDALYDMAREWVSAEDALTAAIVAADGPDTDGAYAAAVTRRNAAHAALRAAMVTP